MAELKESQQVQRWQDRISVSKKWRDQIANENNWERYYDELKGKYDVKLGNIEVPPLNEVFSYKDALISNLYFRDPYIAVNPKTTGTIEGSYILEAAVNYYWRELKIKDEIELEITDAIMCGHAWNKTGANIKTSGSGDQLRLEKDSLFANRVSWRDMFMNVGCRRPTKDNMWIAQRIYRPTEDVKKDYGSAAKDLTGAPYPSIEEKYLRNVLYKDDFNYSCLYEIWDFHDKEIYLVADGVNSKYLEDPRPWPDYLEESGFDFLSFHDIPDEPYPQSDIGTWEPQLKEKIKVFTQMLNHIKRWNRQMIMKKGTMGLQELDKFEKGIDGAILTASTSGDIQSAFKMIDFGSLPPDIYLCLDRIEREIDLIRGMAAFSQGGVTRTSTRTEGELQLIKSGSDSRTDRKQARIERHCENIARKLIAHIKNQFNVPTIAKITGKEPAEILQAFQNQGKFDPVSQTITFSADDIKGEYDVAVKAGSTLPLDKGSRDKILDNVMQMGAQLAAVPALPPFLVEVVKERLRDYDIKGLEVAFDKQQEAQQAQQAEQSQTAAVDTMKTQAEAQKRQAQSQQIQVDTLIKGLNAAGKATGVMGPEESLMK